MSQIDKIIYIPLLIWFWVFFIVLYFLIFVYFLGYFFYVYRVRILLINSLMNLLLNLFCFYDIFLIICKDFLSMNLYKIFRKCYKIRLYSQIINYLKLKKKLLRLDK